MGRARGSYKHKCLLNTGCDYSLIPRRLVPTAKLDPMDLDIYAANGAPINILGHMTVEFFINGMQVYADLLVSDDIYEFMLGYNWLAEEGVHWFFNRRVLVFQGKEIPRHLRPSSRISVSQVLARERVVMAPWSECDVPVKVIRESWRMPEMEWLFEPQALAEGCMRLEPCFLPGWGK